eukprot:PLAT5290.3.p1 GENE.PLAT5290.3~~PLAT5290.3.p1  ORF type:complete len:316 (-),score=115.00 PLAT5290.3:51-998(-)
MDDARHSQQCTAAGAGKCYFAHGAADLRRKKSSFYKTRLCVAWMQRRCELDAAACSFAHGVDELRARPQLSKRSAKTAGRPRVKPCWHWIAVGSCRFGDECLFIHDMRVASEDELLSRAREDSLADGSAATADASEPLPLPVASSECYCPTIDDSSPLGDRLWVTFVETMAEMSSDAAAESKAVETEEEEQAVVVERAEETVDGKQVDVVDEAIRVEEEEEEEEVAGDGDEQSTAEATTLAYARQLLQTMTWVPAPPPLVVPAFSSERWQLCRAAGQSQKKASHALCLPARWPFLSMWVPTAVAVVAVSATGRRM